MDEINEIAMYSEDVCTRAVDLVRFSRDIIVKEVNSVQLITYYILGMWIVEEQQNGDKRAEYGKSVLKILLKLKIRIKHECFPKTLQKYRFMFKY